MKEDLSFSIAIAKESDVDRLIPLCAGWAKKMNYDVTESEIKEDILRMQRSGVVIFAHQKEDILGIMTGIDLYHFWVKENIAHEHWFFVRPDIQGRGLGKALESAFCAWALTRKCKSVMMTPNYFGSMDPHQACHRMKKFGYEVHGYQLRRRLDV